MSTVTPPSAFPHRLRDAIPLWAAVALLYDVAVIVLAGYLTYKAYGGCFADPTITKAVYVLSMGGLGGALMSARYIVYAVRHSSYDARRFPWQILTPVLSSALAGMGAVAVLGGLLTVSSGWSAEEPTFTLFLMGMSSIVGIASESFIKRLIAAAESLFGERTRITHKESGDVD